MIKNFYSSLFIINILVSIMCSSIKVNAQVFIIGKGETATSVSNDGNTISLSTTGANFYWTKDEGIQLLNIMPENTYNVGKPVVTKNGKNIAVSGTNPDTHLVEMAIFDVNTKKWSFLGTLGASEDRVATSVWGMTPDGTTVVGLGQVINGGAHGVYWTAEKGLVDIGSTIKDRFSRINSVSNDGRIFVGWQDDEFGLRQAAYWENGNQYIIKGNNDEFVDEFGAISGNGKWMLGSSTFNAIKWSKETGLVKIEHPNTGMFFRGAATASNNDGSVILGYYRGWPGSPIMGEGFIWTEQTGRVELNQFIKEILKYDDLGIKFALPLAISENGRHIVGYGLTENQPISFLISLPDDLSTKEVNKVNFDVFPNPTTEFITINSNGEISSSILYNTNGEVVLRSNNKQINISSLPKGIYIIKTIIDGNDYTKKVIKK